MVQILSITPMGVQYSTPALVAVRKMSPGSITFPLRGQCVQLRRISLSVACGQVQPDVECWDWCPSTLLYFSSSKNFVRPLNLMCFLGSSVRLAKLLRLHRNKTSVYKVGKCRNATKVDRGMEKEFPPTPSSHGGELCDTVQDLMEEVVSIIVDGYISQDSLYIHTIKLITLHTVSIS